MIIKNLVLSGGGVGGLNMYGAIKNMIDKQYLHFNNIEKIYCVSIGAIIGVIFSLGIENDTIYDYLLKKPWHKFINIKAINIINLCSQKGIFDKSFINIIIKPLLQSKGISENVTLKELYDITNIEINMFTIDINSNKPEKIKLSYITYPDLELCTALAMTSCVPIVFAPIYYEDKCLVDGGIIDNFPLGEFLEDHKNINDIEDTLLCFHIVSNNKKNIITKESNLLDYLFKLMSTLRTSSISKSESYNVDNIVKCYIKNNFVEKWNMALYDEDLRYNLIQDGINDSNQFITESKNSFSVSADGLAS